MKNKYILLAGMLLAGSAFVACDDDKQLTLDAPEVKLLETITFDVSEELPLPVGMDSTITYTYGPEDADDPTILFTSSDESVATVDQNGTIRALKVGEAVIPLRDRSGSVPIPLRGICGTFVPGFPGGLGGSRVPD